jgi:large subunit ribosomal protein L24
MKLKKGDTVKVLAGKDKGKTGQIERIYPDREAVLIAGINEFKKHLKSRSQDQKSEIITINKPLTVSNVAIVCGKCKKASRIGYKMEKGKKVRICRNCKAEL